MKGCSGSLPTRFRRLGQAAILGVVLTSTVSEAQETEKWWDSSATRLPEEIVALQREAEAADRSNETDQLREQIDLNAQKWEETRREHDRKLAEVFDAADEHARNAAKWQQRVRVLQLMGATLSLVSAVREPSPVSTEPMEITEDDLAGEDIVLCE